MKAYKVTTSKMYNDDRTTYYRFCTMNHFVCSVMCGLNHTMRFQHDFCSVEFSYGGHSELLYCSFSEYVLMVNFAKENMPEYEE